MASNPNALPNKDTQDLNNLAVLHQMFIGATGALTKNSISATPIVYSEKSPLIDPPPGSIAIDNQSGIAMPAVNVGVAVTVMTFTMPDGWDGVLKGYNVNVTTTGGFTDFSGDLIWQLQIDGRPVQGMDTIQNQRGTVSQPRLLASAIEVKSGSTVTIVVFHQANVGLAGSVVGGIWGYRYPRMKGQ